MKQVYLAGAVRTPIGKFGGTLESWSAADMGERSFAARERFSGTD
jgi:acetyl-CoA acetyltransferase